MIGVLVFVQHKFLSEIENLLMLESAAEQKETKFEEVVQTSDVSQSFNVFNLKKVEEDGA